MLFKYGEERSIVCDCTLEEKTIVLVFTQNGYYGNQPHAFEALIESNDTNDASNSCSLLKQVLTSNKHSVQVSFSFCAVS